MSPNNLPKKKKHAPKAQPVISYELAIYLAWQRGLLEYKLLKHQESLFKVISNKSKRKTAINCSRRFGKTTTLLIYAFKFAIQNKNSMIRFISPTQKSLRKNIFPIIRELLVDCPDDFRPKWNTNDGCYVFPNGSELHLYGTDSGQSDSLRGQKTDLAIVDEAAFCQDNTLRYIVQDVLLPQTLTCNGRIILASTPQKFTTQSGEEFKEFCNEAELNGSYHTKTIYDNTSLSKRTIEEYCKESGGEHSVTWQVEYLCKFMVDPERRIVPEWDMIYVADLPSPQYYGFYHKYVSMDLAVKRDYTCMLFAYYDFHLAKLVIMDEWVGKNMTSQDLVQAMKHKENLYFTNGIVYRRVSDSDNLLLLNDLCSLHALPIIPTTKTVLEAMVNEVRLWVNEGRVIIHPRCKYLVGCLNNGVWANSIMGNQKRDFGRTDTYGHFDGIAALMYLIRNIDTTTNPIPATHGIDTANAYVMGNNAYNGPQKELAKLFNKKVFRT